MRCPANGVEGFLVLKTTVVNHVYEELWPRLTRQKYWFCPDPNCDVVYYGEGIVITKNLVKTRVFHKESSPERPLCYCAGVTEAEAKRHLATCCKTVEDLKKHTGLGTGKWCPITNPSGRCCLDYMAEGVPTYVAQPAVKPEAGQMAFKVEGMHCEGCAVTLRAFLEENGVKVVKIDFRKGLVVTKPAEEEIIKKAVEEAGYKYAGRAL
ncbi:MAG: cation transporter [Pyrobaculum sp.]